MVDDVTLHKVAAMERCLQRIEDEVAGDVRVLAQDITRQDAVILNLQRLCEVAIDLAAYWVRAKNLGSPESRQDLFLLLAKAGLMPEALAKKLAKMVGFRNIAVHEYQALDLEIVFQVIEHRLEDFRQFATCMLNLSKGKG